VQHAEDAERPAVLVLCVIGAYEDNAQLFEVWVMLGAGVVAYLMRKYEPAPLIVGLVRGPVMERSLRQTLDPFCKSGARCPTRCYAPLEQSGKAILPLDSSTLLPCARFARSCSKCESIRDRGTQVVLRKPMMGS